MGFVSVCVCMAYIMSTNKCSVWDRHTGCLVMIVEINHYKRLLLLPLVLQFGQLSTEQHLLLKRWFTLTLFILKRCHIINSVLYRSNCMIKEFSDWQAGKQIVGKWCMQTASLKPEKISTQLDPSINWLISLCSRRLRGWVMNIFQPTRKQAYAE